jgi:hypothetical protein
MPFDASRFDAGPLVRPRGSLPAAEPSHPRGERPVDTITASRGAARPAAHLLIHAGLDAGAGDRRHESVLQRLRAIQAHALWHNKLTPISLHIDDMHGRRVHSIEDAGTLVDVRLPAGTYHVTVHVGNVRRRYTLTLESGSSVDLYPRVEADRS